jgi:WD40 repeat protein
MKAERVEAVGVGAGALCVAHSGSTTLVGLRDGSLALVSLPVASLQAPVPARAAAQVVPAAHVGAVTVVAVLAGCASNDASRAHDLLASGSADRTIKVWHHKGARGAGNLECVQTLHGHGGTVTGLAFGGGLRAQRLVSCATDGTLRVWAAQEGRSLLLYPFFLCLQTVPHSAWLTSLALGQVVNHGDPPVIFCGDGKGTLLMLRPGKGLAYGEAETTERFKLHELGIHFAMVVPQQNLVVTLGQDHTLRVFDVPGRSPFLTVHNRRRCRFSSAAWDPLNHELVAVDERGFVEVWNIYTDRCLVSQSLADPPDGAAAAVAATAAGGGATALGASAGGAAAATVAATATATAAAAAAAATAATAAAAAATATARATAASTNSSTPSAGVTSVHVLPHDSLLVSLGNTVQTWQVQRHQRFKEHAGHSEAVVGLVAAPLEPLESGGGGSSSNTSNRKAFLLFSCGLDNTLCCWDWYDMSQTYCLREPDSEMACLARLPDSGMLATGNEDGSIRIWSCDTGSAVVLKGHTNTVTCLDVAERRKTTLLISAGYDGCVAVWDVTKRHNVLKPRLEAKFTASSPATHAGGASGGTELLCVRYIPPGREQQRPDSFATGGNDGVVRIWHMTGYDKLAELVGHREAVSCLQVDGDVLLSGSDDGTVRIWNVCRPREARLLGLIDAHLAPLRDMALLASGSLATCSKAGQMRVWDYTSTSTSTRTQFDDDDAPRRGKTLCEFNDAQQEFRCLAFCAATGELLVGTQAGRIIAFDPSTSSSTNRGNGTGT